MVGADEHQRNGYPESQGSSCPVRLYGSTAQWLSEDRPAITVYGAWEKVTGCQMMVFAVRRQCRSNLCAELPGFLHQDQSIPLN